MIFAIGFAVGIAWAIVGVYVALGLIWEGPIAFVAIAWPLILLSELVSFIGDRRYR